MTALLTARFVFLLALLLLALLFSWLAIAEKR